MSALFDLYRIQQETKTRLVKRSLTFYKLYSMSYSLSGWTKFCGVCKAKCCGLGTNQYYNETRSCTPSGHHCTPDAHGRNTTRRILCNGCVCDSGNNNALIYQSISSVTILSSMFDVPACCKIPSCSYFSKRHLNK